MTSVDVVLPCLNEREALVRVIGAMPPDYRIILVDNGSTDGSADLAAALGATVVRESIRGYGAAVHAGLTAATADIVVFLDCDGSIDPAELPVLVADVAAGRADLCLGRRRPVERGAWPWHGRYGNRAMAAALSFSVKGLQVRDLAPVRVARRSDLLGLGVTDRRSGLPVETLMRAASAGWRIIEHDVSYRRRAPGTTSKITGSVRGTVTAVRDIARIAGPYRRWA